MRSLILCLSVFLIGSPVAFSQKRPQADPSGSSSPGQLVVPQGTRLPLVLRSGVNTRTAKPGDSVYFETIYPIAVNNRMAIPMGSFVRGEIIEAKRPGRLKGRGEFRIAIEQMTFPSGYTIELAARPSSLDRNGQEGVDPEGKIKGDSSAARDVAAVLVSGLGGAYVGSIAGAASTGAAGHGALLGGGIGGFAALVVVLMTRGVEAELPRGTGMDVVLDRALVVDSAQIPESAGTDPLRALPVLPPEPEHRRFPVRRAPWPLR
jgi:hypothetical protein